MGVITRIIPPILVVSAALTAVFIVGSASLKRKNAAGIPPEIARARDGASAVNVLPVHPAPAISGVSPRTESTPSPSPEVNATELLAARIAAQIAQKNPERLAEGPLNTDELLQALPPDELLSSALDDKRADITRSFEASADPSLLKTVAPTAEAVRTYTESVTRLTNAFAKEGSLFSAGNPSLSAFETLRSLTDRLAEDLARVPVPEPFRDWHANVLALAKTQANLLGAVAAATNDPLKGLWALEALNALEDRHALLQTQFKRIVEDMRPRAARSTAP